MFMFHLEGLLANTIGFVFGFSNRHKANLALIGEVVYMHQRLRDSRSHFEAYKERANQNRCTEGQGEREEIIKQCSESLVVAGLAYSKLRSRAAAKLNQSGYSLPDCI